MNNKMGFNNFKAFGSQMQYFTKKPITLIYGPNSVGKSSLLHSQLYFEYFKQNKKESYSYNSSFAGDNLDIGGFENFIHKHNKEESLNYEFEITEKKDIFALLVDTDRNLINSLCNKINEIDINNSTLEETLQNTNIKLKYFIEARALHLEFHSTIDSVLVEEKFLKDRELLLSKAYDDSDRSCSFDDFMNLFINEYNTLNNNASFIEKLLIVASDINIKNIDNTLVFFNYISQLTSIKYNLHLSSNEDTIKTVINFEINNEEIFKYDGTVWNKNEKHNIFQCANNLHENFNDNNELSIHNFFIFSLEKIVDKIFAANKMQYYGPLRHYPQRWEMFQISKEENEQKNSEPELTKSAYFFVKIGIFFNNLRDKYKAKNFIISFLLDLTIFPQTLIMLLGMISDKNYRKLMTNSDEMKDIWNKVLPDKFHFMRKNKLKSNEIWKKLAISKNLLAKINHWLGDTSKLKSTYKIDVKKEKLYYGQLFFYKLDQFLDAEKIYFSRMKQLKTAKYSFKKILYKIIQVCHSTFIFIENKVNTKNKYMNQIVFTDILKQTEVTPRDMGLGVSQMLPILISTMGSKDTKIYLEQPELHLHPAVQMELMDEFIKSHNENNNEFMMESHSEHMLLRVMKRLRQTAKGTLEDKSLRLTPDDVCLLYVDNDKEQTYVRELRLSKSGKLLDHWPNGFFEEGYKERFL